MLDPVHHFPPSESACLKDCVLYLEVCFTYDQMHRPPGYILISFKCTHQDQHTLNPPESSSRLRVTCWQGLCHHHLCVSPAPGTRYGFVRGKVFPHWLIFPVQRDPSHPLPSKLCLWVPWLCPETLWDWDSPTKPMGSRLNRLTIVFLLPASEHCLPLKVPFTPGMFLSGPTSSRKVGTLGDECPAYSGGTNSRSLSWNTGLGRRAHSGLGRRWGSRVSKTRSRAGLSPLIATEILTSC